MNWMIRALNAAAVLLAARRQLTRGQGSAGDEERCVGALPGQATRRLRRSITRLLSGAVLFASLQMLTTGVLAQQQCFPWTATVSSGNSDIKGYSPAEVCQALVARGFPNSDAENYSTRTYAGLSPTQTDGSGYYCKFDQVSIVKATGAIYPRGTFSGALDGTILTQCTSCPSGSKWVSSAKKCVPIVRRDHDKPCHCQPHGGNPVYPLTGSKRQSETLGNWLGQSVTVTFDSRRRVPGADPDLQGDFTPLPSFGPMWESSLHKRLFFNPDEAGVLQAVQASRGGHSWISFLRKPDGSLAPDSDVSDRLAATASGWRLHDPASKAWEDYDQGGLLQKVSFAEGRFLTYTYSDSATLPSVAPGPGFLIRVQDQLGRSVQFQYEQLADASVRVYRVIGPDGGVTLAGYDSNGNLTRLTWPDTRFRDFLYEAAGNPPSAWTSIASEGQSFSVVGPHDVRYGSDTRWVQRTVSASGICDVNFFGSDPAVGTLKHCERLDLLGLPWALTGIIDENTRRHSTYAYDMQGRAKSTELAGGVNRHTLTYSQPPMWSISETYDAVAGVIWQDHHWAAPQGTTMLRPNGSSSAYGVNVLLGAPRMTSQSLPAGSGSNASSRALVYDGNGNLASADDFNGSRSCSAHDLARNLETTHVEGLSGGSPGTLCSSVMPANAVLPAGSRKTSSQWHPDWRVETKRAEPGRITTYVYNGQPDPFNGNAVASCAPVAALLPDGKPIAVLCKQVQQATTDANGALGFSATLQAGVSNRQTSWTYNQVGQVLTEDGPRTDVVDITKFEYYIDTTADHTLGDLKQVTNALNKLTRYTKYNKHGQVLESIDGNNVVTVNTFNLRQRLLSSSVGGQTTSYTYDAVGQLKRVTQPDTSWIGYDYDDAHRQVAVYDNKGNKIIYTLDNDGIKTGEDVRDPGGALKRQLIRTIDALGRVQQITGRE